MDKFNYKIIVNSKIIDDFFLFYYIMKILVVKMLC